MAMMVRTHLRLDGAISHKRDSNLTQDLANQLRSRRRGRRPEQ